VDDGDGLGGFGDGFFLILRMASGSDDEGDLFFDCGGEEFVCENGEAAARSSPES